MDTKTISITSNDLHYSNVFKFDNIGSSIQGYYWGTCRLQSKFDGEDRHLVIRREYDIVLVKMTKGLSSFVSVARSGDLVRLTLKETRPLQSNPEAHYKVFEFEINR